MKREADRQMASRLSQQLRRALQIFIACALCIPANASNACPWMNEATASGLLGDDVVGSYKGASSPGQPGTCTFTRGSGDAVRTLVIEIETAPDAAARMKSMQKGCSSDPSSLQAIGNEAIMCAVDRGSRQGELVVGRVRDQMFTIRISSSIKSDPVLTRESLTSKISSAAEQIAGNLF